MEKKIYQIADSSYWLNGNKCESEKEKFSQSNLVNLLITEIVQDIPGVKDLPDNKFIAFQEHITKIVQKEMKKLETKK